MRSWKRWLCLVAGLAAAVVAVASAMAMTGHGSVASDASVAWLPAVIVATATGPRSGRCLPRRRR